ncbi:MAG: response regulator transcription factor [Actinomycetota bacterium]|nr:response regulator transcription factor [Actinomycetota bacterium]
MSTSPGLLAGVAAGRALASSGGRVLVVEDDEELLAALRRHLREEGFHVEVASDGEQALAELLGGTCAGLPGVGAVVLDLLLPGLNGREVCHRLRAAGCWVPVLIATAYGELEDRLAGFGDGADDYLVKPFSLAELVVRLRAIMRRSSSQEPGLLSVGDLTLDLGGTRAWRGGAELVLSRREYDVLRTLMRRPGIVLSRNAIVAAVWGRDASVTPNLLDQYISRLRRKVDEPFGCSDIETVLRVGYRIRAPH